MSNKMGGEGERKSFFADGAPQREIGPRLSGVRKFRYCFTYTGTPSLLLPRYMETHQNLNNFISTLLKFVKYPVCWISFHLHIV